MSKVKQNVVLFMEPSRDLSETTLKCGNMYLNRFSIDEDAAFEISGVYYFKEKRDFTLRKLTEKEKERYFRVKTKLAGLILLGILENFLT